MRKFMNVTLFQPAKKLRIKRLIPSVIGAGAIVSVATSAFATGDTMVDLFSVVDISGAQSTVYAIFVGLLGIGMLFFGRRILRKMGISI